MSRRAQLVRERTRSQNEIHAIVIRRLVGRPPATDLFGVKGRKWLTELELPVEERETLGSCLRQIAFLTPRSPTSTGSLLRRPWPWGRSAR
jgi:transposase